MKITASFIAVVGGLMLTNLANAQPADPVSQATGLFDSSRYDESKELLDAYLRDHPQDARALSYRGRIALVQNDFDRSIDWCEKAVKLEDGNAEYHLWLARAYGLKTQNSGKLKQAFLAPKVKREFERAVELDSKLIPARMGLMQYYMSAPGVMGGSKDKAKLEAGQIKIQDPYMGYLAYAMLYETNDEKDKARQEYLAAIQAYPDSLLIQYQLGYFYQNNQEYEAAFSLLEAMLKLHPEELNALYQIGRTGAFSGQKLERAEECLKQYLTSTPGRNDPPLEAAHFRLGQVYEKWNKKELAVQEYQTTLKLNPKHDKAKEALKKLN
jgi:tetratricopeptide (TPR) repeat protein